jgi:hypothetical protein
MIKRIILYSLAFLTGSIFLFSSTAYALDISIGVSGWYAWWNYHSDDSEHGGDETLDPEPLYGPVLAINFSPNWSLTSVFLYGNYDFGDSGDGPGDMDRYDSDTALNYSLNRYIKLFGGLKFMGYDWGDGDHMGYGPALGIAFTLPLIDNFYLLLNVSGMYLIGKEDTQIEPTGERKEIDYFEIGVNSNISIAYYIAPASTSIILGFRYQYFEINYDKYQGDMQHAFYGATLAAVYSFSL